MMELGSHLSRFIKGYLKSRLNNHPKSVAPTFAEAASVPKIIHQTYPTKQLPPELQNNIDQIKANNPDWEHHLYDDADIEQFIRNQYGDSIFRYYQWINPNYGAARADLFRYLLLYKTGGVYLDIKSTATKKLNEIIRPNDVYLLSQWKNRMGEAEQGRGLDVDLQHVPGGDFQQWHIVAASGHPFLKAVLDNVLNNINVYNPGLHGTGKKAVLRLTGPIAYTLAIYPLLHKHKHKHRFVDYDKELGFRYSIFYTGNSKLEHRKFFKPHYSDLTEPLTELSAAGKLAAQCLHCCKLMYLSVAKKSGKSQKIDIRSEI
jgi:inositol phosphorylceramide mannosyltransferase catalytic subunit